MIWKEAEEYGETVPSKQEIVFTCLHRLVGCVLCRIGNKVPSNRPGKRTEVQNNELLAFVGADFIKSEGWFPIFEK